MAEKKHNALLWLGLGGIGLLAAYEYFKNKQPSVTTSTTLPAGTSATSNLTPIASIVAPVVLTKTAAVIAPNGIDPTVYSEVQKWAESDNRPPVLAMAAANVPSEYTGMYNIITNFWDKGISPDQTAVDFWNNLRDKYDPSHAYW